MASAVAIQQQASQKTVYISLQKKHIASLAEKYELHHGLFIKKINPYINEGYLQAYFRNWGSITQCKICKDKSSESKHTQAYVRFSTEDEADRADWAGPHYIGGTEVEVRRVVSPKRDDDLEEKMDVPEYYPQAKRSLGIGYILEDAQWLDDAS